MSEWTYIINGPCIVEVSTCIDDAGKGELVCSQTCLELALGPNSPPVVAPLDSNIPWHTSSKALVQARQSPSSLAAGAVLPSSPSSSTTAIATESTSQESLRPVTYLIESGNIDNQPQCYPHFHPTSLNHRYIKSPNHQTLFIPDIRSVRLFLTDTFFFILNLSTLSVFCQWFHGRLPPLNTRRFPRSKQCNEPGIFSMTKTIKKPWKAH